MIMGIDEAGRGSVFGPLVIGAALFDSDDLTRLLNLGLKDSKLVNPHSRIKLYKEISQQGTTDTIIIPSSEIDKALQNKQDNLNKLEIRYMAKLIHKHHPHQVIIDAVSSVSYFCKQLQLELEKLQCYNIAFTHASGKKKPPSSLKSFFSSSTKPQKPNFEINILAENKADLNFPVVSAASIVAKVERDQALRDLEKKYNLPKNSLGKGYPNKGSEKFLQHYQTQIKSHIWPFIRYSWNWKPLQKILNSA